MMDNSVDLYHPIENTEVNISAAHVGKVGCYTTEYNVFWIYFLTYGKDTFIENLIIG